MINRQKLSSDEIEDQRELMSKLQWLLSTLSEAGILPTGNMKGKPVIFVDESPPELPKDTPAADLPRSFDPADNGKELPPLTRGFGPGCPNNGLNSFAVHAVLPQPKSRPRSPVVDSKMQASQSESKKGLDLEEKEHFFEAYYIIPRSVPRTQPRGQIQLTKPVGDDYMIICLDTKLDYRKDSNLRNALRRAKRARDSVTPSIVNGFPRSVQEAALSLATHRKRHANGLAWSLVEGVELRCLEESVFRRSPLKSGFLIVFRGTGTALASPPLPPSILKGSVNNQKSKVISSCTTNDSSFVTQQEKAAQSSPSPSSPSVSFGSLKMQKQKRRRASRSYHFEGRIQPSEPSHRDETLLPTVPLPSTPEVRPRVIPTAAPAFDPFAAAYQAGKIDGHLERFGGRNSHHSTAAPRAVVSRGRRDSIEDADLNMAFDLCYSDEVRYIDEPKESLPKQGDLVKVEGSKSSKAKESTDQEDSDHVVEGAPPAQSPHESYESGSDEETISIKKDPTFSETTPASLDDIGPKAVSKRRKTRAKVEFENASLLKGERPVTRPLPGPVLYDPARSKLMPSPQSPVVPQSIAPSSHRRMSSAPVIQSSPRPAVPQRPENYYAGASYYPSVVPGSRPLSERFAPRPLSSSSAHTSYNPPLAYTMVPPPTPVWTASSRPSSSMRRPVTSPNQGDSTHYFGEKIRQAESYQEEVAGLPPALAADTLKREQRRETGSSRYTRSSISRVEADYRKSATTKIKCKGSDNDDEEEKDEDATIRVTGAARVQSKMFTLDTNLSSMEGIQAKPPTPTRFSNSNFAGKAEDEANIEAVDSDYDDGILRLPSATSPDAPPTEFAWMRDQQTVTIPNPYAQQHDGDEEDEYPISSSGYPSGPQPTIVDERPMRRRDSVTSRSKPTRQHRKERIVLVERRDSRTSAYVDHHRSSARVEHEIPGQDGPMEQKMQMMEEETNRRRRAQATRETKTLKMWKMPEKGEEQYLSNGDTSMSESGRRTAQKVLQQDEEIRKRPAITRTSRNQSEPSGIRSGAAIASAGLAGAAITGLYEKRKAAMDREKVAHRDSDSASTISDSSSASGDEDEDSTLVEEKKEVGEGEELHLTQSEAEAMMMNFLATFTTV
jgi:hypothetical protein